MGIDRSRLVKKVSFLLLSAAALMGMPQATNAAEPARLGVVKFRQCVEQSKFGQKEQEAFEALRERMQSALSEKETALNEIARKFQDPDFLDGLSDEAEAELKHKFRVLSQDLNQFQNEYYQQLNQANMRIMQQLSSVVASASNEVAKSEALDAVVNDDAFFFFTPDVDVTGKVIAVMDRVFNENNSDSDS
jgi:outer membrane protein